MGKKAKPGHMPGVGNVHEVSAVCILKDESTGTRRRCKNIHLPLKGDLNCTNCEMLLQFRFVLNRKAISKRPRLRSPGLPTGPGQIVFS